METASLDEFTALNDQLAALVEAGVPLDVGFSPNDASAAEELDRINSTVARRVNRGESLSEALEGDERDVPAAYRSMMQLGLQTGDMTASLDGSTRVAESADDTRFTLESAFFYPLILCSVAYFGLIGLCLYLVPTWEEMYADLNLEPRRVLRFLVFLRETLAYWVVIPLLFLLAIIMWWRRARSRRAALGIATAGPLRWFPGARRILFQERSSRFAASLSALLANDVPLHKALPIAGESSGDSGLAEGARILAADAQQGALPSDDSETAELFPPFLRWAIWHSESTIGRAKALEIAARMYREAAERRAERLRTVAPMAVLVLLGGTVTLLYALAVFVPIVDFLRSLAV